MKAPVLFDAEALQTRSSRSRGIGFYSRNHMRALAARDDVDLRALVHAGLPTSDALEQELRRLGDERVVRVGGGHCPDVEERDAHDRRVAEAAVSAAALACGASIFHNSSPFEWETWIPLRVPHVRVVATVYDLIPHLFPAEYLSGASPAFRAEYQEILDRLARADRLVCISECTRQDVIRSLDVDPERVHVIGTAVDDRFRPIEDPDPTGELRARWQTGDRFVLYTGGYDFRKNFERLFEAFAASTMRDTHRLVIVCRLSGDERRRVRAMAEAVGLGSELVLTGFVPDDDQVRLYNLAELVVFPSRYEGFGLPVLEAMQCGTPVVCSSVSSMPEIAADAGLTVDPLDPRAIREAMEAVVADGARAADMRERGLRRARDYSWDIVAARTAEVYAELARDPLPRPWRGRREGSGPRVALLTPMPPVASGIADMAASLVTPLAARSELTVLLDGGLPEELELPEGVAAEDGRLLEVIDAERPFDHLVAQVGNGEHHVQALDVLAERGGVVLLHDLVLHHLWMARTLGAGDEEGYRRLLAPDRESPDAPRVADLVIRGLGSDAFYYGWPVLGPVLERADAIAVFSAAARRRLARLGWSGASAVLPMPVPPGPEPGSRAAARAALGLDAERFLVGSFGVQTPMKRPDVLLEAAARLLPTHPRLHLVFVGEELPWTDLGGRVARAGLDERVTLTGRVDAARYRLWTEACDAILALRYPHRHETSAAALAALERGRPVIVNDFGTFAELPAGTCLPVPSGRRELDGVIAMLSALHDDPALGEAVGRRARAHVLEAHAPERSAAALVDFLATLPSRRSAS